MRWRDRLEEQASGTTRTVKAKDDEQVSVVFPVVGGRPGEAGARDDDDAVRLTMEMEMEMESESSQKDKGRRNCFSQVALFPLPLTRRNPTIITTKLHHHYTTTVTIAIITTANMASDLDMLIDMGFEKARAEIALKKAGGLQDALQWLEDNQDKSLEDIQAAAADAKKEEDETADETQARITEIESGQAARSLVCNDCGKRFRNQDLASYHAGKTDHENFSESTEEIAPLTEEEKKARLAELRERLQAKKSIKSEQDREDQKRNER
ncbi:hypothetical protein G7046_g9842 [Stylonectria norvegica]|nr:hypothetical protein G7046_g9842 [Stylonectria norvegica]